MAKNLKEALEKNRRAAQELDRALRDCLAMLRDETGDTAAGRFQVIEGGRRRASSSRSKG